MFIKISIKGNDSSMLTSASKCVKLAPRYCGRIMFISFILKFTMDSNSREEILTI